ncbi:hypothetical protein [Ruegeria arenilitoris]|uniref:hypothetical protein n=1 Tax=Ruegeria arenilitoris TaxID=1173585 RepID=UPI00147FB8F5|nr:hypothetical protein [Ruegeria arenilitoris]
MNVSVPSDKSTWRVSPFLLLAVAVIACLSVLLINGGPLYYYDTGSYIRQGNVALNTFLPTINEGGDAAGGIRADQDSTATGSRSLIYGIVMAIFFRASALTAISFFHLASVLLAVWLLARAANKSLEESRNTTLLTAVPLLIAAITSLPFYIAYMMPDIFAPVLLIVIAVLTAFGRSMQVWELLLLTALAVFSVISHPSHLAIAGLMVPFVILAALSVKTPGRWRAVMLVLMILAIAVVERKAFQIAVETRTDKEVVYTPHITARLIVDGPGMDYLDEVCPNEDVPTCALHEALSWSDDPYRLTVSHIIFERSPRLGSFRLMTAEDRKNVALAQRDFAKAVFLSRPIATTLALAENGYRQILRDSIWMTIPTEQALDNARHLARLDDDEQNLIQGGLLSKDRGWIEAVDILHGTVYAASFVTIVVLLLIPRSVSRDIKLFALFILIGIAVNALVCGGVSQPADRYGARVMWLLPFTAAFLLVVRWSAAPRVVTERDL